MGSGEVLSSELYDGQVIPTLSGKSLYVRISGSTVYIQNDDRSMQVRVVSADVMASNGVAHVIESVLLPAPAATAAPSTSTSSSTTTTSSNTLPDLVNTLVGSAPEFTTLVTAVSTAGLVPTLSSPNGPYTVFAPNNAAFAALPAGTLDSLLADPSGALTDVLKYHVVSGQVLSSELYDGQMIPTLSGKSLYVLKAGSTVYIQNDDRSMQVRVVTADVMASNGVAHVIESVLLPAAAVRTTTSDPDALSSGSGAAGGVSGGTIAEIAIGVVVALAAAALVMRKNKQGAEGTR